MNKHISTIFYIIFSPYTIWCFIFFMYSTSVFANSTLPTVTINVGDVDNPGSVVPALKILALLTILSVAPAIVLMTTSFTRILVVLAFTRQALGTQNMPPNQVIISLALFLTLFTMSPIGNQIYKDALQPYLDKTITQEEAFTKSLHPIRTFMLSQTRENDIGIFLKISKQPKPQTPEDIPMTILMPAFLISELKTAFQIGFLIYIPFLIIDMVVSSVLMTMGMLMLPPTIISLPFKLILFVLVDGWSLIIEQLVRSFNL